MEIHRFGVGHRRAGGPAGTRGVASQVIHGDARGTVTELAFGRRALMEPHLNPNTTWFLVIEGGGWIQVGEERALVAAGEAVLCPAGVPHGVWTEHAEMRAIVVELAGPDDSLVRGILGATGGGARRAVGAGARPIERGEGRLATRSGSPRRDPDAGEPD